MIHELSIPLPVVTPKGKALAFFLIDYSIEHHLMWVCFQDDTGECWTVPNPEIRIQNNPTVGRQVVSAAEPLSKTSQEQSQPLRSRQPPPLPPSVEAVFRNQSDRPPLSIRE